MKSKSVTSVSIAATIGLVLSLVLAVPAADAADPRKAPHRTVNYPAIGHQVRTLPQGHRTIQVDRQSYRYHNGSFYSPGQSGAYVVVRAPIGARVRSLPPDYVSFGIGPRHYFYANFTYYLWDRERTRYIVVEEPEGAEQQDRDRYECYSWAVEQTGFDPGADDYRRAISACLEGRGYTVR